MAAVFGTKLPKDAFILYMKFDVAEKVTMLILEQSSEGSLSALGPCNEYTHSQTMSSAQ